MPDQKISDLTPVSSLGGTETIEVVQTTNKRATLSQVKDFLEDTFANLSGTAWDVSTGGKKIKTLTADTEITLTNSVAGTSVMLIRVIQDATGGRTITIAGIEVEINPDPSTSTLIGIVDVGAGQYEIVSSFGTGGSTPPVGGWEHITFPTLTPPGATVTEDPAHIFTASAFFEWDHQGLSDMRMPADGRIRMLYEDTDAKFGSLMMSVADGLEDIFEADLGVVIYASGAILKSEGGTQSGTLGTISVGDYVSIQRVGSTFRIQTSPDGDTWTTLHTYTFTSSANMYIKMCLYNNGEIHFPMGEGVV